MLMRPSRPSRLSLALVAAAAGVAVAVPLLAVAGHVEVRDADDTKGLLDVQRIDVTGSERPTWNVITFSGWSVARLFDAGYLLVRLDTFGDARFDYYALVRSDGSGLRGTLVRDRKRKPDFNVGALDAWHPTRSSVRVRVPLRKMRIGEQRITYGWRVQTLFSSDNCPRVCIDNIPDDRAVRETIPGRGPVATPTVTPTVVPTETPTATPTSSP